VAGVIFPPAAASDAPRAYTNPEFQEELREYLEREFQVLKLDLVEES
jgi:hypothetical protein